MPGHTQFADRDEASCQLGTALARYTEERPLLVLALPRGGVPIGARVAEALNAPLDVFLVRKLGVPGYPELAMGAIASGGTRIFNHDILDALGMSPWAVEHVAQREATELRRREIDYRGDRRFPNLIGETVLLVDDGAATGASMRVAIDALRELAPRAIVAAVPVASRSAAAMLRVAADDCVTLVEPDPFHAVGHWYSNFSEVTDDEVRATLDSARRRWESSGPLHAGSRR